MTAIREDNLSVELPIGGMTCASCAARIEKKLNKLDGVTATVNFATEKASVSFPAAVNSEDLISVVERAGYTAALPAPPAEEAGPAPEPDETAGLRQRLLVSLVLAVPVVVLAMVPALQFRDWQWLSLALAAPVAVWGAWPFHRAALVNARHRAATMDTLISVGVTAAFAWSLYALFFTGAGMPGMRMSFTLLAEHAGTAGIYPGRGSRGDGADPARSLLRGPRQAALRRGAAGAGVAGRQGRRGAQGRPGDPHPGSTARGRGPVRRPPGGKDRRRRGWWNRAALRWTPRCSPASQYPRKSPPGTR
jgi:copper chaperone CopZ